MTLKRVRLVLWTVLTVTVLMAGAIYWADVRVDQHVLDR